MLGIIVFINFIVIRIIFEVMFVYIFELLYIIMLK